MEDTIYRQYISILKEELIPAMGCTEPISIAYASAKARAVLGDLPDRILVEASGNIIKNVKSVVVPHTGGLRGIPAAAAAGAFAGDEEAELCKYTCAHACYSDCTTFCQNSAGGGHPEWTCGGCDITCVGACTG